MLEQIIYEFEPVFSKKNLKCKLLTDTDINLRLDINKMERVFDKWLRNAINYSFRDEVIEVSIVEKLDKVILKFVNYGDTIPEEKLGRIFEQFHRLDISRGTRTGGAGLGLAVAKEIVELHGGDIRAFSKDEVIEFEVTIPIL